MWPEAVALLGGAALSARWQLGTMSLALLLAPQGRRRWVTRHLPGSG